MLGLGLGVAGRASGWVVDRAGFWGVLATWVNQGLGSSSPQVLRHPTSMCDSGINNTGTMDLNTKKGINTLRYKNLIIIVICTYQKQCHVLQCYVMLLLLSMNNEQ